MTDAAEYKKAKWKIKREMFLTETPVSKDKLSIEVEAGEVTI